MNRARILPAALVLTVLTVLSVPAGAERLYTMDVLVREAVAANPDLLALEEVRAEREAELRSARASRLPEVRFRNSYSYIANPPSGYTVEAGSLGSIPTGPFTSIAIPAEDMVILADQDNRSFSFGLQIDQPLFTWGKIRNGIAVRESLLAMSGLDAERKRDDLITEVTAAVYSLASLRSILDLLHQQEEVGRRMLEIALETRASGQISEAELIETRMEIREIAHSVRIAEAQRLKTLTDLRFLTGIVDLEPSEISFTDIDPEIPDRRVGTVEELTARALERNAAVRLGDKARELETRRLEAAKGASNFKPDVGLGIQLGYGGSRVPWIEDEWDVRNDYVATVTLLFSTTFFDGGGAAADVEAAASRLRHAEHRADSVRREVSRYVELTLNELSEIRRNILHFEARAGDTAELAAFDRELYESGGGSLLDYLARRLEELAERVRVLEQELGYTVRYLTLMNVAGGM